MIRTIIFVLAAGTFLFASACKSSSGEGKTASGFKYTHHIKNEGPTPQTGDYVTFQLLVTNGETTIFDSHTQEDMPIVKFPSAEEMAVKQASPILEGLQVMAEGDSLTVYFPVDSFGQQRPSGFENAEFAIYSLFVKDIQTQEEYKAGLAAKKKEQADAVPQEIRTQTQTLLDGFKASSLGNKLVTTKSGLQYVIVKEGTGPVPTQGQYVEANYCGMLTDGTIFDNSYFSGQPLNFPVAMGQVIPGWDEAFTTLKTGTQAVLFIPSTLAYGERAMGEDIPANSDLVFFVELISAQ